jgi:branched-chain amino acid transport system ATP-binding protein
MKILRIENLVAGYGNHKILDQVSLYVEEGHVVIIAGANGSGKSTLLKSILNLSDIFSGYIRFQEKIITGYSPDKLISMGISFVAQGRQIFKNLSVGENLKMGGFLCQRQSVAQKRIEQIFDTFPFLKEKKNQLAGHLSGGQQQILAITIALMQNPKLLIIDEPLMGLSSLWAKNIISNLKKLNDTGVTILIAEHNLNLVAEIADRMIFLEEGKIQDTRNK